MNYEPEYGDLDDLDSEVEDDFNFEDCPYGSGGYPQLGMEDCEFTCPLSKTCQDIFYARKDCVNPLQRDDKGCRSIEVDCVFFHMGNCYIDFSNYSPRRRIIMWFWRVKCRLGIVPLRQKTKKEEAEQ